MSSGKGITSWADKDGSFKRQVSAFRDRIEEGGKFAPEKGELFLTSRSHPIDKQGGITCMSAWRVLGHTEL